MGKKRKLLLGSVIAALVLSVVTVESASPAPAPKPEGELVVAVGSLWQQNVDPHRGTNASKFYLEMQFDQLVGINSEGQLDPKTGVAEKWEVSPDSKKITFWIRKGIKFQNGDALTAEDVKFSVERALSPYSLDEYKGYTSVIKEVKVVSPYVVELILKGPAPRLIYMLGSLQSYDSGVIVPKKYVKEKGDEYFALHPVGSGPYKFHSQQLDAYIKYEAVSSPHWRVGIPKYKYITFKVVPDVSTRVAMLKRGETDIAEIGRAQIKEMKDAGLDMRRKLSGRGFSMQFLQQWSEGSPMGRVKVREAMNLAIDRKAILDNLLMGAGKVTGVSPSGSYSLFYPTDLALYRYDPERAKQLLKEAGYPQGFKFTMFQYEYPGFPEGRRIAEVLASYFEAVGLQPKIEPVDYGALKERIYKFTVPNSLIYGAYANRLIGEDLPSQFYLSNGLWQMVRDPSMDALINNAIKAVTMDEYKAAIHAVFKRIHGEYVNIPIAELDELFGVNRKTVGDWDMGKAAYGMNLEYLFSELRIGQKKR